MSTRNTDGSIDARAVLYTGRGGPEVVTIGTRPVRLPETGEVRIKVASAAVNPTDILLRDPGRGDLTPPLTPGMDAAGVVESMGEGVTHLAVGDEVMAAVSPVRPEGGAQAEYIVVPAASVVARPDGIVLNEAATLPMNGLTALYALEIAALKPGQTFAVSGGAGWLAYLTIVIAKLRGLRVITDANAAELDLVRGFGADIVVERGHQFAAAVRSHVPLGVDALLDTALLGEAAFPALKDGGVYIPVRGWNADPTDPRITIKPVLVPEVLQRTDWLNTIRELTGGGFIVPRVASEFAPEDVAQAQKALLAGGVRGRPIILW